ncbi:hypothetical protein J6590_061504 [Homalodisca vitripennis]|nr:hypothetical protein J6590_061504 [Homalodisca vitripennis]
MGGKLYCKCKLQKPVVTCNPLLQASCITSETYLFTAQGLLGHARPIGRCQLARCSLGSSPLGAPQSARTAKCPRTPSFVPPHIFNADDADGPQN